MNDLLNYMIYRTYKRQLSSQSKISPNESARRIYMGALFLAGVAALLLIFVIARVLIS